MPSNFDNVLFKQRTRELVSFFKENGVDVPLTLGYEGVARFLFGAKSWNNLAADLKKGLVSPNITLEDLLAGAADAPLPPGNNPKGVRLKCRALVNGGEETVDMFVYANFHSSDGQVRADFSVTSAFSVLRDESLLQLAATKWTDPKFMEPMSVFRRGDNDKVREVLEYVENRPGLEVYGGVDRRDALRYVRAFRPHLLAKVLLLEKFGTLAKAAKAGFKVSEGTKSRAGLWSAKSAGERLYPDEGDSEYFTTEAEAWDAVSWDMLEMQGEFEVSEMFDVLHGSGTQTA
jgi:hypothetical protein